MVGVCLWLVEMFSPHALFMYYLKLPIENKSDCKEKKVFKNNKLFHNRLVIEMTLQWQHPFTSIIAGPTSCGKSFFVTKFLEHLKSLVDSEIIEIVWCFGESQPLHNQLKDGLGKTIKFHEGIPDLNDIAPESYPPARLVIIDDLMRESNGSVVDIFSKGSHHRNLSIIFITQNVFHQGKGSRDMSLNAHYIVLFKNPRDKSQIFHFARQVCPENSRFVLEAFLDATSKPHSYLLFDMKQSTPEAFRFRSDIFPGEENTVYVPKKCGKEYSQYFAI